MPGWREKEQSPARPEPSGSDGSPPVLHRGRPGPAARAAGPRSTARRPGKGRGPGGRRSGPWRASPRDSQCSPIRVVSSMNLLRTRSATASDQVVAGAAWNSGPEKLQKSRSSSASSPAAGTLWRRAGAQAPRRRGPPRPAPETAAACLPAAPRDQESRAAVAGDGGPARTRPWPGRRPRRATATRRAHRGRRSGPWRSPARGQMSSVRVGTLMPRLTGVPSRSIRNGPST